MNEKNSVKWPCQGIVSSDERDLSPLRPIDRIFISTATKEAPKETSSPESRDKRVNRKWQRDQMPGDNK